MVPLATIDLRALCLVAIQLSVLWQISKAAQADQLATGTLNDFSPTPKSPVLSSFPGTVATGRFQFTEPGQSHIWHFMCGEDDQYRARFVLTAIRGVAGLGVLDNREPRTTEHGPVSFVVHCNGDGKQVPVWVQNRHRATTWTLQVDITRNTTTLQPSAREVFGEWHDKCCTDALSDDPVPCEHLLRWSQDSTPGVPDPCWEEWDSTHFSWLQCNAEGEVTEMTLSGSAVGPSFGPVCLGAPPSALEGLPYLEHLELVDMQVEWSLDDLAAVLEPMENLSRLYLHGNSIGGELSGSAVCALFEEPRKLSVLSMPSSPRLPGMRNSVLGAIDSCVFSNALTVLNLDENQVEALPWVSNSQLHTLRLARQQDPEGASTLQPDSLQRVSLLNVLAILDLSNNGLTGSIPDLPANLQWLDLSGNSLEFGLPEALFQPSLSLLNLAGNTKLAHNLTQTDIARWQGLSRLNLSSTGIHSQLSTLDWSNLTIDLMDLSNMQLEGAIPASLARMPSLQYLDLSLNPGISSHADFAAALVPGSNQINCYNVSGCGIGDLPGGLQHLAFFSSAYGMEHELYGLQLGKVFDISHNTISTTLPPWLLTTPDAASFFFTPTSMDNYGLGIQASGSDSNSIQCPSEWPSRHAIQQAVAAQHDGTARHNGDTAHSMPSAAQQGAGGVVDEDLEFVNFFYTMREHVQDVFCVNGASGRVELIRKRAEELSKGAWVAVSNTTSTTAPAGSPTSHSTRPPMGAIIGTAVGAVLLCLLLAVLVMLAVRWQASRGKGQPHDQYGSSSSSSSSSSKGAEVLPTVRVPQPQQQQQQQGRQQGMQQQRQQPYGGAESEFQMAVSVAQ